MTLRDLGEGVWTDDAGALHLDVDACLTANGIEPNEQTRAMLLAAWAKFAADLDVEMVVIE